MKIDQPLVARGTRGSSRGHTTRRLPRFLATAGCTLLALAPCGVGGAEEAEPTDPGEDASRGAIRISSAGLHPRVFETGRDEVVSWVNEEEQHAVLSFPEGFTAHLACDADPRPQLREDASGRLLSLPIRSLPYALPCALEPGRHPYRVHLLERGGPPGALDVPPGQIRNPHATFEGILVVP